MGSFPSQTPYIKMEIWRQVILQNQSLYCLFSKHYVSLPILNEHYRVTSDILKRMGRDRAGSGGEASHVRAKRGWQFHPLRLRGADLS